MHKYRISKQFLITLSSNTHLLLIGVILLKKTLYKLGWVIC